MRIAAIILGAAAFTAACVAVQAASMTIEQAGQQFSEKSVTLAHGDVLTFANHDDVTHNINVVDDDDDATDLGLQKPGQSLLYKFDKSGKFKVRCSIHPSMKMSVNVK